MAIKFTSTYEEATVITHGGNFHADDIFCICIIEYLYENIDLYRLRLEDEATATPLNHQIWFDIGGGAYDHHQKGGNGYHELINPEKKPIPYASFGLIWKKFGREVCQKYYKKYENEAFFDDLVKYAYDAIEYSVVRGIDASDNGIFPVKPDVAYKDDKTVMDIRTMTISCVISLLNESIEDSDDENNAGLLQAIYFAKNTIFTLLAKIEAKYKESTSYLNDFGVEKEYRNIIFGECLKYYGLDFQNFNLSETNKIFPNNMLYDIWNVEKEECLKKYFGDEWNLADRGMSSLINGLCADMEGINARAKGSYDDVYFATFKDVFGVKEYYSGSDYNEDFKAILDTLLEKYTEEMKIRVKSIKVIKNALMAQKGRILVLNDRIYWRELIHYMPEAQKFWFVVNQTQSGLWKVNPIRSKKTKNGFRKGFPKAWLGLRREELESQRNIHGVYFIHDSGMMALCDDKKSAINLCKKAFGNTEFMH